MRRSNIYLGLSYLMMAFLGGFLAYSGIHVESWKFWVLLFTTILYGLFTELKKGWRDLEQELREIGEKKMILNKTGGKIKSKTTRN